MSDGIAEVSNESSLTALAARQVSGAGERILDLTLEIQRAFLDEVSLVSDEAVQS